jgi:hypothetical protein
MEERQGEREREREEGVFGFVSESCWGLVTAEERNGWQRRRFSHGGVSVSASPVG